MGHITNIILTLKDGYALNLFINGNISTRNADFNIKTDYPKSGKVTVKVISNNEFCLYIRNPKWSKKTQISINKSPIEAYSGYVKIQKKWNDGDVIEIDLDMDTRVKYPIKYDYDILMNKVIWGHNYMVSTYNEQDPNALNHIALLRGPIVLAQENRLGYNVDTPMDILVNENGSVDVITPEADIAPYEHILEMQVPLKNGTYMTVTDYSSAGKLWNKESKMAAWIKVK